MTPASSPDAELTYRIIGLAMRVHRHLRPGLLESARQRCLCHTLSQAAIPFKSLVRLPIRYHEIEIEAGYQAEIIVRGDVILELKAMEQLNALHEAQLLTYLGMSGCRTGLLININTPSLTDAIRRRVL